MEEEEIYIDLFDRYHRNEIDHADLVDSLEEMDIDSNISHELHCYQTALAILEQGFLKEMIHDIGGAPKSERQSTGGIFSGIPLIL